MAKRPVAVVGKDGALIEAALVPRIREDFDGAGGTRGAMQRSDTFDDRRRQVVIAVVDECDSEVIRVDRIPADRIAADQGHATINANAVESVERDGIASPRRRAADTVQLTITIR